MQTVSWLTFCISNTLTKTTVHFFPSANNVSAPYPVNCKLTLFGGDLANVATVVLEGARLRQPDGVRVDDIFTPLKEELAGLFGLGIELMSPHSRLDLSPSQCLIDISAAHLSCRFRPTLVCANDQPALSTNQFLGVEDTFGSTSIVIVNGSNLDFIPSFEMVGSKMDSAETSGNVVNALSAREIPLQLNGTAQKAPAWSETSVVAFQTKMDLPKDVAGYIINRNIHTREPVSVCAL